jgi:hypothetical protein
MLLGEKVREIQTARAQALAQTEMPLNRNGGNRRNESVLRCNTEDRGNSALYLVRRLKRAAPEAAAALTRGEYPSACAAAKAAGIVKDVPPPGRASAVCGNTRHPTSAAGRPCPARGTKWEFTAQNGSHLLRP